MKKVVNLSLKINSCLKSGQLSLKIDSCLFQYTENKQPLSDFQAQIGVDPKQPEAQLKNGVALRVSENLKMYRIFQDFGVYMPTSSQDCDTTRAFDSVKVPEIPVKST